MSLSFEDSLKNNEENAEVANNEMVVEDLESNDMAAAPVMAYSMRSAAVMANALDDDENWERVSNAVPKAAAYDYKYYNGEYNDTNYSTVDEQKNIILDPSQFNITQESYSQYIPFQIPRYYDGFDLAEAKLSIYYVNKNRESSADTPVDVYCNDDYIRFAWLVSDFATRVAGMLQFEIHARGNNSKGESYVWKSKSIDKLNVLQSLEDISVGDIGLSDEEVQGWYNLIREAADSATKASILAQQYAEEAAELYEQLQDGIADEVQNTINETVAGIVDDAIADQLESYYTKTETYTDDEIDEAIEKAVGAVDERFGTLVDTQNQPLTVEAYVKQEVDNVDVSEQLGTFGTDGDGNEITTVVDYVDYKVGTVDISGQLGDLGDHETVTDYVDAAVADVDISGQLGDLGDYETVTDYIDAAIDTVDVSDQLSSYYNKTEIDAKVADIAVNKSNLSALSQTVIDIQDELSTIDKSARKTYDIVYNDEEDENSGENVLVLYEIENEGQEDAVKSVKRKYVITGGNGGSASQNELFIYYDKDKNEKEITSYVFTKQNFDKKEAIIYYDFAGFDPTGSPVPFANGEWQIRKGTTGSYTTIERATIYPNTDIPFNVSTHITSTGTYSLRLVTTDDTQGYAQKIWTIQMIDLSLVSNFNDKSTYPAGQPIVFDYMPSGGSISKTIYFKLDGEDIGNVTTTASGVANPVEFKIPAREHGSYLLDAYMVAKINEEDIETDHIYKDIMFYDPNSDIPVIGCSQQTITMRQYDTVEIVYSVYDPKTETPEVGIWDGNKLLASPTLTQSNTDKYHYKALDVFEGEEKTREHIIKIKCGDTVEKTLKITVEKININVQPVTSNLVFDFNPIGYSNNDVANRLWSDGSVKMTVSDNFDWTNGGYQTDKNGDQYFCIKAGTSAEIDYQLFADEAKVNGKEFKLVFKTTNVATSDAKFLECIDDTTGSDHIGITMNVHEAQIYGKMGGLKLPYSEEDIIEFEFNISKDTEAIPMVMGYEDGVATRPMVYDGSYDFTQNTPQTISLGSTDCDLHIYRFKVYNASLTDGGILNNFIADARNAEEMVSRYERNQIYDENNQLDPDILAEKCPWLRVIKIEAPFFTSDKYERIGGTTIQHIYKNGTRPSDNWTATDAAHSGQGTSSNNYGAAGRNLDLMIKRVRDKQTDIYVNENPIFTLSDGTKTNKVSLTENSVPVNYFNVKVNIASSNNLTNALLAKRYNEFNPYDRAFVRPIALEDRYTTEQIEAMSEEELANATAALRAEEQAEIAKIKDTMEFYNCVIFVKETDTAQDSDGNYIKHREFNNTDYNFYALGNIGDSKKTDDTRLTDMDDEYECCLEVMDVRRELSDFPVNTIVNAMRYEEDKDGNKVYLWAKDENLGILYEFINGEYVLTKDTTVNLDKTYYVDALIHDDFSEDFTYGWRYISDEDDEDIINYCHQKWIEAYRFIVRDLTTNGELDAEKVKAWKSEFENYFVLNSILYYYLFTTRYCMVDNRAKNLFFHYGKTNEVDFDGNPIRKWDLSWDYDNDTSLGLNNYGAMVYRYGLEDTDVDENGTEVFRESDSTFFCRIRDLFADELEALYQVLETNNAWKASVFIEECDTWQSQFPEELWRLDIERKYKRTYTSSFINGEANKEFLKTMANGKMKYHRRQWERSQEQYMASKYKTTTASSDNNSIILRCQVPSGDLAVPVNCSLKIRAYDTIYLNVQYGTGNNPQSIRVTPDKLSKYINISHDDSTDIIKIYSAPFIQSLGDVSACYPYTVAVSNANKLKELIIGNETPGYDNSYFSTLELGANPLLEKINVENISGLGNQIDGTTSLDLSLLNNLKELYAHGTNVKGVTFADGGKIHTAELPAINALTMKNLMYLTDLDIADLNQLTTLVVENCQTVDLISLLNQATNINRIRLTNVDWVLEDASLLERLYAMKGKDKDNHNIDQPILTGKVYVKTIKEKQFYDYQEMWSDLEITYDPKGFTVQYPVTFVNYDGAVLDVQWVDERGYAVNPIYRNDKPISTPIKPSNVSTDYHFVDWDIETDVFDNTIKKQIFSELTVNAIYSESVRKYKIKYVIAEGIEEDILQESEGDYGTNVPYTGKTPTYVVPNSPTYYLFNRWDDSGFIYGDKTVTAIFDNFRYTDGAFRGRELKELSSIELYTLLKLMETDGTTFSDYGMNVETGDDFSFNMGYDIDYDDIDSETFISQKRIFSGNTSDYYDTNIPLFDVDKDFVLAVDYKMLSGNTASATIMQCLDSSDSSGFKLSCDSSAVLSWGGLSSAINEEGKTVTANTSLVNSREMLVLRHKQGDNNLYAYISNLNDVYGLNSEKIEKYTITRSSETQSNVATLIFGAAKANNGRIVNPAKCEINWCKIWYKDLGDDVCRKLVSWTHEQIALEVSGFNRYQLYDNTNQESTISLLASHLLSIKKKYNSSSNNNTNGWASCALNAFLNGRFYDAIPYQIKALMKKVLVKSTIGNNSETTSASGCFVNVPALYDVYDDAEKKYRQELYEYTTPIDYFTGEVGKVETTEEERTNRIRRFADSGNSGDGVQYWLRSPSIGTWSTQRYCYSINQTGTPASVTATNADHGVLIELSF